MISKTRVNHAYNYLEVFQTNFEELVKRIIKELPWELKNNVTDVEDHAAYDGCVCINFHNWQRIPYDSDDIIKIFEDIFDFDVEVRFWMDGTIDDERFAIMVYLENTFWEVRV